MELAEDEGNIWAIFVLLIIISLFVLIFLFVDSLNSEITGHAINKRAIDKSDIKNSKTFLVLFVIDFLLLVILLVIILITLRRAISRASLEETG